MWNFEVVEELKYVGVKGGGRGRNIFQIEKKEIVKKANIKAAQLISEIKKIYDKTTVGKAVWKLQKMPAILYGKQVVTIPKHIIKKLQAIENRVYRYLIGATGYTTVAALRGEVGASRVETRVMETVLAFARDSLTGSFEKIKEYMEH